MQMRSRRDLVIKCSLAAAVRFTRATNFLRSAENRENELFRISTVEKKCTIYLLDQ